MRSEIIQMQLNKATISLIGWVFMIHYLEQLLGMFKLVSIRDNSLIYSIIIGQ